MPIDGISVKRLLRARRERVFEAWTHPDLMARWFFPGAGWTAAVTSELKLGGRYEVAMRDADGGRHTQFGECQVKLRFVKDGQPVNMGFRIDEMKANERVRWTCVTHDMPTWVGTTLTWRIGENGGGVVVSLEHDGWKDAAPESVAQGWRHFIGSLKSYVETGTGQPW